MKHVGGTALVNVWDFAHKNVILRFVLEKDCHLERLSYVGKSE
jgi:hypothetical protein